MRLGTGGVEQSHARVVGTRLVATGSALNGGPGGGVVDEAGVGEGCREGSGDAMGGGGGPQGVGGKDARGVGPGRPRDESWRRALSRRPG